MRFTAIILFYLCSCLCNCNKCIAQVRIIGNVHLYDGSPIENTIIIVKESTDKGERIVANTTTDEQGQYVITLSSSSKRLVMYVSNINITDKTMEFVVDGKSKKYTYKYVGKHTLTYSKGNRGVRFMFEATDADAGQYKYVQFSDHNIAPTKAAHFHIFYGGESQEALFDELENWPTYYPSRLTGQEIAQEMLAH